MYANSLKSVAFIIEEAIIPQQSKYASRFIMKFRCFYNKTN
jgi:hypothetical protein